MQLEVKSVLKGIFFKMDAVTSKEDLKSDSDYFPYMFVQF